MQDGPEILMPVTPAGAVEQMLLEELRRLRESNDKVLASYGEIKTQLALIIADGQHAAADRSTDRVTLADHGDRINKLESWKDRQDGARGFANWLINSPVIGWIVAAAAVLWAVITGRPHV